MDTRFPTSSDLVRKFYAKVRERKMEIAAEEDAEKDREARRNERRTRMIAKLQKENDDMKKKEAEEDMLQIARRQSQEFMYQKKAK